MQFCFCTVYLGGTCVLKNLCQNCRRPLKDTLNYDVVPHARILKVSLRTNFRAVVPYEIIFVSSYTARFFRLICAFLSGVVMACCSHRRGGGGLGQGVWYCCLPATHRSVHPTQKFEKCCPIGTQSVLILFCEVYSMAILLLALKLCTLANWSREERLVYCAVDK